jgi:hypothetical protein
MITVRGRYRDGNIQLSEAVSYHESNVLVIFLDGNDEGSQATGSTEDWDGLNSLIEACQMKTGIPDLAHQHDHYLHDVPKQGID